MTALAATAPGSERHLLLIAGRDSHGPDAHNHEAGMRMFAQELAAVPGLRVSVATGGWPEDESLVDKADAGFGFTGGHFHKGWDVVQMRRIVLNAMIWVAGMEVPDGGAPVAIAPAAAGG